MALFKPSAILDGMDEHLATNRALWDEWAEINARSAFYDLEEFKRGGVRIRDYEIEEVGPVRGKTLLHLQCHFGIDSLSWARLGAKVTGVDFSERAIELATGVAAELGIDASFIRSNLYDLPQHVDGEFDIVYTSRGVLCWLPRVRPWADVVARFVGPGGSFYVTEAHPILWAYEDDFTLKFPYWEREEPSSFDIHGSYADPAAEVKTEKDFEWNHSLGEIVTAPGSGRPADRVPPRVAVRGLGGPVPGETRREVVDAGPARRDDAPDVLAEGDEPRLIRAGRTGPGPHAVPGGGEATRRDAPPEPRHGRT